MKIYRYRELLAWGFNREEKFFSNFKDAKDFLSKKIEELKKDENTVTDEEEIQNNFTDNITSLITVNGITKFNEINYSYWHKVSYA